METKNRKLTTKWRRKKTKTSKLKNNLPRKIWCLCSLWWYHYVQGEILKQDERRQNVEQNSPKSFIKKCRVVQKTLSGEIFAEDLNPQCGLDLDDSNQNITTKKQTSISTQNSITSMHYNLILNNNSCRPDGFQTYLQWRQSGEDGCWGRMARRAWPSGCERCRSAPGTAAPCPSSASLKTKKTKGCTYHLLQWKQRC